MTGYRVTEQHVREARQQGDLKELLTMARTEGTDTAARNRRLVLAHPDLAQQLTEPPCKFTRPEAWTGYIGPKWTEGRHGELRLNDSPYRQQLVDILAAAHARLRKETAA